MSKTKRGAIKRSFTKVYNELKEEIDKGSEVNIIMVKRSFRQLEDRFGQLESADEVVMQEMVAQDASQEAMNEEIDARQEYRDRMNDMTLVVEGLTKPEEVRDAAVNQTTTSCCSDGKSRYKLPKLELVKYDGEPKNWLNFWSQYKGIHEDINLPNEEKFQYLIQATAIDSPARNVVSSFPPTSENYPKAVKHLKSRFGKDKILIEVYVRDLLKLVTNPNMQYEPLATLYDSLTTKLRALESLGVTSDKYAAMLFPLVESTLSDETLQTWERVRRMTETEDENQDQLSQLMKFLQKEVESETRLRMAKRGISGDEDQHYRNRKYQRLDPEQSTATDLMNKTETKTSVDNCIFCGNEHRSQNCISARKMLLSEKNKKVIASGRCFKCLQANHLKRNCKVSVKCGTCGKSSHCTVMCIQNSQREPSINAVAINHRCGTAFLQTLLVTVEGIDGKHILRAIIDTGSHQSYISQQAVKILGLSTIDTFETAHSLFGGFITRQVKHGIYRTVISNVFNRNTSYKQEVFLLDQATICSSIPPVADGPWIGELKEKGIQLSDFKSGKDEIDILLGADTASMLFTGKIYRTKEGPVAFETELGWTLMGKSINAKTTTETTTILHSLYIGNSNIQDLWRLDLIGIHDSTETKSREGMTEVALNHFKENIKRSKEGRYEVALPWIEGHPPVATNHELSYRRLESSIKKLQKVNKIKEYDDIFQQWLKLGIIEKVEEPDDNEGQLSYLPHHPVFNWKSLTTPIRPVFDASAKSKGEPSLNDCLEKGPNLLELIMILLLQFRMKQFGVIADIEKAFLQISIREEDRNFLRFLWYENGKTIIYRHCRVVFGISASSFLLAATFNHHLDNANENFRETAQLLKKSTYVDNCVTSVDTKGELKKFMNESTILCKQAQFNLRGWVWNRGKTLTEDVPGVGSPERGLGAVSNVFQETSIVSVLGLLWDTVQDTLSLDLRKMLNSCEGEVTKRSILSATHRIFDPLGFASPVTIVPKKILQSLCKRKVKWDEAVPEEICKKFRTWIKDVESLQEMKVPRWVLNEESYNKSIHIFSDACQTGYAAVAFMRSETAASVTVQFLISKARVSTIKPITTNRLELISCECGVNLAEYLKKSIDVSNTKWYFWSDSSNALSWIKRKENWQAFVHNRVKKIRELTDTNNWLHIPGDLNPADLPSRGCSPKQLIDSRWWEGPKWLKNAEKDWPKSEINCDEAVVMAERKNLIVSHVVHELITPRYFSYFSKLRKVIRMIAWILRWKTYRRSRKNHRGELTLEEEEEAEKCLWRMVQAEVFTSSDKTLKQIKVVQDEYGLWRVKTKLFMREDSEGFRLPILLPKQHIAVDRLIQREHIRLNHCGSQVLRNSIRENFWILQARVRIRQQVYACKRCKRYRAKACETPTPPLPANRVRDASVFEVVGIDLGGPLYLEGEQKSWFVIFTCAVFRAVHLELVTSLSTYEFIQALRRFIARRMRPAVIYTDNGTNFKGTENLLAKLDWKEIMASSTAQRIKWIFNPPSAPWWGGWWERIVGMVKELLRRVLGKSRLTYEEMVTLLCDCEYTINSRPLTYLSDNPEELIALTPMMFLNDVRSCEVPDLDKVDSTSLVERYRYRQILRQRLRERFRIEYLSTLVHRNSSTTKMTTVRIGDVVLVETENRKRVDWPIAIVTDVFPGIDGIVRSVQLKVIKGSKTSIITRPTKRLYLLEASITDVNDTFGKTGVENKQEVIVRSEEEGGNNESTDQSVIQEEVVTQSEERGRKHVSTKAAIRGEVITRGGRKVKIPDRFQC